MEIVNGHSVPFRMNLPSSVTAVPRDDAPLGSVPDFFGRLYEQKHPSEVLIPAESKRVFHVDPHALESPVELYGNIEWDILAAELVLWAINLAAKNAASRDVKRETAGLKEFEQWYGTADDINEVFSARSRWLVKPVRRRRPGSRHAEDRQVTQRAWSPR